jgi:hypothetical protein
LDENDVLDADEDSPDTVDLDVTVGPIGIPASQPLLAYSFALIYPSGRLEVTGELQEFLITNGEGSVLFSASEPLPDGDGEFHSTAADTGDSDPPASMFESGPGVLSRVSISSVPGQPAGIYDLILYSATYVNPQNEAMAPDQYNHSVAAIGTQCPHVQPSPMPPPPPENDDFTAAQVIESLPFYDSNRGYFDTTESASIEPGEPLPCGDMDATIWYAYTPHKNEWVHISTYGSNYRAAAAAYTGDSLNGLTLIECDDTGQVYPGVVFLAEAGETYRVQIGGVDGEWGRPFVALDETAAPTASPTPTATAGSTQTAGPIAFPPTGAAPESGAKAAAVALVSGAVALAAAVALTVAQRRRA